MTLILYYSILDVKVRIRLWSKPLCSPSPGWWFDACGPSNLNGVYFPEGQHIGKLNGIKWHYFKGPSYSLRATAMMIRPLDFP